LSSNISSIAGGRVLVVTPPVYATHYEPKQSSVRKKSYPGATRREVFAERLSFIAKDKKSDDLHEKGERPAGKKYPVDEKVSSDPALFPFCPICGGVFHKIDKQIDDPTRYGRWY
jgi:hypothetical protein